MCDVQGKVNIISLYQAGNGIYDQFDKVAVIAEGRLIYYGPRSQARGYFEDLGFEHIDGANTADYLTAVTALAERRVKADHEGPVPMNAKEFADVYRNSAIAHQMQQELQDHLADDAALVKATTVAQDAGKASKSKGVPASWANLTPFSSQLKAALIREYQQRWGNKLYVVSFGA